MTTTADGGVPLLGNLPFVALGRVKDATTLATWHSSPQSGPSDRELFGKLLVASQKRLEPGQRTRLKQHHGGSVCCMLDARGMLVVCLTTTTLEYPERLAFLLLQELLAYVYEQTGGGEVGAAAESIAALPSDGLQAALSGRIQDLVVKYEDPAQADQHMQALGQLDNVKSVMRRNLVSVIENRPSINELSNKVERIKEDGGEFSNHAEALTARPHRSNLWLSPKFIAIMALAACLIFWAVWHSLN